jgi:hypothetical protein
MSTVRARPRRPDHLHQKPIPDLRRLWRPLLAVLVPVPGLALGASILISPYPVAAAFSDVLAGVAADPGREQLSLWLGLVFTFSVIPSTFALAWVSRRRAPRLAFVGGLLTLIGFTTGFNLPGPGGAALVTVRKALDHEQVAAIANRVWQQPIVSVSLVVFLTCMSVGLLLLAVALWRSRATPRWAPLALGVSVPLHLLGLGGNVGAAASWVLTAVACVGVARALVGMSDGDFDLPPLTRAAHEVTTPAAGRSDTRSGWRVLLAVSTPFVAVYVAVARYLMPYDMADTPEGIFAGMVAHPGYESVASWVGTLLTPTCVSGVVAVAWLSRRRAPVLTTVGLLLAFSGFVALFAGDSFGSLIPQAVASHPELDAGTAYALGSGMEMSAVANVTGLVFVLGHLIGTIVLGIALFRSRVVSSWIAIALAVSQPIHLLSVMTGNRPLDLVGWGSTALGFAAAGWVLLHTDNDDFDLPPV